MLPYRSNLMKRTGELGVIRLETILGWLAVAGGIVALYVGAKVLPLLIANSQLSDYARVHVGISAANARPEQLGDAIYHLAQNLHIPLNRENIKVETNPSWTRITRITVDYKVPVDLHFYQPELHFHVQYPEDKGPWFLARPRILAALGLLLGLYWFFKGFLILRKYRIVADTPLTPIRSMAMGLVQIRGKAVGERTLASPVSRRPCHFYKVNIERWEGSRGSGRWSPYLTDAGWVKFYLEDESGKVLVDPRDAECDLEEVGQAQVSKSPGLLMGYAGEPEDPPAEVPGLPPSPSELRSYVVRAASGMRTALYQGADLSSTGFVGSQQRKSPAGASRALISLTGVFLSPKTGMLGAGLGPSAGDYRLTEQCILPDSWYDITGTCAENREARNELDRLVVAKGENTPTFLISRRSEKQLEGALRARALRYIFGGAFLAIGFAAALLQTLGYL